MFHLLRCILSVTFVFLCVLEIKRILQYLTLLLIYLEKNIYMENFAFFLYFSMYLNKMLNNIFYLLTKSTDMFESFCNMYWP